MTLAGTRGLIDAAVSAGSAVAGFNVITLEHAEAIISGAEVAGCAVILQISENAVRFHGSVRPIVAACRELAISARVPASIHLDHIQDLDLASEILALGRDFGVGSIMIDASNLADEQNVAVTARIAAEASAVGLWVEAELGEVGGKDGAHAPGVRTDPADAREFVRRTRVDALAVAVGSSHAMTTRSAELDTELIGRLADSVEVPLVLHGSSGVPDEMIAHAVRRGIRKVNIGTALNLAFTGEIRVHLASDSPTGQSPSSDPRRYLREARSSVAETVAHLCSVVAGRPRQVPR